MGSTKWGHQRKAVALIKTDALRKSSAVVQKNFIFRQLQFYPNPGHTMTMIVPASVSRTLAIA
ncbi:hypothetical protein CMV42_03925 [Escherichia coli]|nr:hypothetical protein CMV42_03925 [Escherichia coli]